jgi:hypothetical protein
MWGICDEFEQYGRNLPYSSIFTQPKCCVNKLLKFHFNLFQQFYFKVVCSKHETGFHGLMVFCETWFDEINW